MGPRCGVGRERESESPRYDYINPPGPRGDNGPAPAAYVTIIIIMLTYGYPVTHCQPWPIVYYGLFYIDYGSLDHGPGPARRS